METDVKSKEDDQPQPSALLNLPPELQAHIYSYLTVADIRTLRRTNHHYHSLFSVDFLRIIYTPAQLNDQLTHICGRCFWKSPPPNKLVWRTRTGISIPLEGRCARCATEDGLLNPSRYLCILDDSNAGLPRRWNGEGSEAVSGVCRWCGWPTWADRHFHATCEARFFLLLQVQFTAVVVRTLWTLVSMSLVLRYYSAEPIVLAPSVITFPVFGVLFAFVFYRGDTVRTYHITGFLEAVMFVLFIPPTYYLATQVNKPDDGLPKGMTIACLVLYAVNLLIRLINFLGSIVLYHEYNVVDLNRQCPAYQKVFNNVKTLLVWWSSPRCMENDYIGKQLQKDEFLQLRTTWRELKRAVLRDPSDIDY